MLSLIPCCLLFEASHCVLAVAQDGKSVCPTFFAREISTDLFAAVFELPSQHSGTGFCSMEEALSMSTVGWGELGKSV
jgi:hypothetical protein